MPTYEYVCGSCENQWEEIQKISEAPIEVCPKCQQKSARRQISGGNFILKGGGWYADLYSSSSAKKGATSGSSNGAATSTEAKSDGGTATKTEAKTEAKSEAKPAGAAKTE